MSRRPSLLCSLLLSRPAGPVRVKHRCNARYFTLPSRKPRPSCAQELVAILTVLQLVPLVTSMYTAQQGPVSPRLSKLSLIVTHERLYTDQRQQSLSLQEACLGSVAQPKELCLGTFQLPGVSMVCCCQGLRSARLLLCKCYLLILK